jgi:MoaA/NifB/PqqE/SkfB family radical SAM enzyme
MSLPNVYCTAPWNGLTIREDGIVRTCCVGKKVLFDLNSENVGDIEKSVVLQQIRDTMLNGQADIENCSSCIQEEKVDGYSTLRNHYNTQYPDFVPDNLYLKFLDIRWNNTCNLSCMYCGPHFSNAWTEKLKTVKLKPIKPYHDELLEWILSRADHIKEIMLVGGEPLLMKQNYELLKVLPLGCRISIITNLSYDLKRLPCIDDLLKRPADNIVWNISAENSHDQFEYVRQGAVWTQLEENIKLVQQHWNNTLSLNMVYSMFNAFDLLDVVKKFKSLGIQKFNLIPISGNQAMNVFCMPTPIRQRAKEVLKEVRTYHLNSLHIEDRDLYPIQGIEQIISSLETPNTNTVTSQSDFKQQLAWYDQWGSTRFCDLWPDVIRLTDQHLV